MKKHSVKPKQPTPPQGVIAAKSSPGEKAQDSYVMATALVCLLLLSLSLRLVHVDFGLPSFLHVDETGPIIQTQHLLAGHTGRLNYNHPPLLKNLAYVGLKLYLGLRSRSIASDQEVVLALRLFSVLAGLGAVAFLYLLALPFVDRRLALMTAFLYAVLPLTVMTSKYGVPDMLLSFLFILGLWLCLKLYQKPTPMRYAATGLVLVLAFGAKYPGCFLALSALLAHFTASRRDAAAGSSVPFGKSLGGFLLGSLIGLCISFPLLFIELPAIIKGFTNEVQHVMISGHEGIKVSGRNFFFLYHFRYSILPATGPVLFALIPAGLIIMAIRHKTEDLIVLAAAVPYYLTVEWAYLILPSPDRYILPLVGPYLLAAAIFIQYLFDLPQLRLRRHFVPVTLLLLLILSAWPVYRTATALYHMTPDTREIMQQWMEKNLAHPSYVWIERHHPAFYPPQRGVTFSYLSYQPNLATFFFPEQHGSYVLASSFLYERYLDHSNQRPEATFFYKTLFSKAILVREVSGENQYLFHNPTLRLYRIP